MLLRLDGRALDLALAICRSLEHNKWRDVVDLTVRVADDPRHYEIVTITQLHPFHPPPLSHGWYRLRVPPWADDVIDAARTLQFDVKVKARAAMIASGQMLDVDALQIRAWWPTEVEYRQIDTAIAEIDSGAYHSSGS